MVPSQPDELPCLRARADPRRFVEATGTRMAWLGRESGVFELWMWPLRLARGIELRARRSAAGEWLLLSSVATSVEVRPDRVRLDFEHPQFSLTCTWSVDRGRRLAYLRVQHSGAEALEVELGFPADFTPQWPAGLGGRIARRDSDTGTLVLTEELGRFAAVVGAPGMLPLELDADHSLGSGPVGIRVPLAPRGAALFTIAGAERDPEPLRAAALLGEEDSARGWARSAAVVRAALALWKEHSASEQPSRCVAEQYWREFLARTAEFQLADEGIAQAFLWAKIAIERAWVEVDGLGRGIVAGLREGGASERPGFGWFFDGDALTAARAMCAYGDFQGAKEVLRFAARHQRADGKLMHELVLSARLVDWVGDYPYAYYKAGNTPAFLAVLEHVVRASGDLELARELLPSAERALAFCESCLDSRGLISNRKAGIAAVEAGVLVGRIETEIFLSGIWISGLRGLLALARALERPELAARAARRLAEAEHGFESFWSEKEQRYGFAHLVDGTLCDDLNAYTAHPLSRGIGDPGRARKTAAQLNRPELATGWGPRMFSSRSSVYDPSDYNTGSVFPYLANFNVLALYEHHQELAGWQQLRELVGLDGLTGIGFVPEHLLGDRRVEPARGVPHQVFSSAAVVQSLVHGWLGARIAPDGALHLRPSMLGTGDWTDFVRFPVRGKRVRIDFFRVQVEDEHWTLAVHPGEGEELDIVVDLPLPPGTTLRSCTAQRTLGGKTEQMEVTSFPFAWRSADTLLLILRVECGPLTNLAGEHRAPDTVALRLLEAREVPGAVEWQVSGPAGTLHELPFRCDRAITVAGAQREHGHFEWGHLRVQLPDGAPNEVVEHTIRFQFFGDRA